ncbi:G-patch domain-containing protein [Colletotrichum paranaense]|uniref:G-patch domain-containing protein n=1 Tax=Colletotrichum paranaense TaxID=1914294 RepID=A0ABQ9RWR8_9PEZI|nr:G-patch domain-containing protein [Colletotrichum paranaense]KAK1517233.1 G-patch domain-containing protein [Colletotrichum paranaense]
MPRGGKKGGARAPPRNAPRLRPPGGIERHAASFVPAISPAAGFTLQDEARSTAHRSSPWSSDSKLRHRPVAFINTGAAEPLKQLESILQIDEGNSTSRPQAEIEGQTITDGQAAADTPSHESQPAVSLVEAHVHEAMPVDIAAEMTDVSLDPREVEKAMSGAEDITGAEAPITPLPFFFDVVGETQRLDAFVDQTPTRSPSPTSSNSSEDVILFRGRNKVPRDKQSSKSKAKSKLNTFNLGGISTEINVLEKTVKPNKDSSRNMPMKTVGNSTQKSRRNAAKDLKRQEDDELIADYIANMREYGEDEALMPAKAYSRRDIGGSLSESEGIDDSFQTVVATSKTEELSGVNSESEHATAGVGKAPEESDEKPVHNAQRRSERRKVIQDDHALRGIFETDVSYLASLEQSLAEDASPPSDSSDQDDDDIFRSAADRFANEIDDFDFMDWSRPALKPKRSKGARGKVPVFDISDSELEGKMQAAWKNDRLKKAERKKERQAMRSMGLLGKHANPEDLRVKYPRGKFHTLRVHSRYWRLTYNRSLTLPPMDNHARKVIHELASKFNIKSKSTGSGDQRRPMLHRTFRTAKFADEIFDAAIARVGRKYFPRNDTAVRAAVQRQSARRGGGGGHAGVAYRDGEVVGGSAPELSQENKGRAMLEKMGWSSGTALGAINNKGILQPVAHVVKRSKAGLG